MTNERRWQLVLALALASSALAGCDLVSPSPPVARDRVDPAARLELSLQGTARVLALLQRGSSEPRAATVAAGLVARAGSGHLRLERALEGSGSLVLEVDRIGLRTLEAAPEVRLVGLDEGGHGHLLEALPLAGFVAPKDEGLSGKGVTVAVLDSGIDATHADLAGKVIAEACFCGTSCCPGGTTMGTGPGSAADNHGHGTHVAGTIASSGPLGLRGGAPDAELIAIKVLDQNAGLCCMSDVVAALEWLVLEHPEVDIVNLSLGSSALYPGHCDLAAPFVEALATAVADLSASGALVVASSGNEADATAMAAPACIDRVVSVGAVWDENVGPESVFCTEAATAPDRIACFSNASATLDLLAPGARINSTWLSSSYRAEVGTSAAAPFASACAALLLEAVPDATPIELASALRESDTALLDERNGNSYPRLDCAAALRTLRRARDAGLEEPDAGAELDAAVDPTPEAVPPASATDSGQPRPTGAGPSTPRDDPPSDAAPAGDASPPSGAGGLGAREDDARARDGGEVRAGGASGCGCQTAGSRRPAPAAWLLSIIVPVYWGRLCRRRRHSGSSPR